MRARRFVQRAAGSGEARYLCQYEFDSDDPAESIKDLLRLALRAFEEGRHIDCIEGAPPGEAEAAPLLEEIDPSTLEPLDRHDYPRQVPEDLRRAIEAQLEA
ncbi:MAG: hypothetical protein J4G09_10430 [Proteobacteria bacterium]|nr:hypothetical protein [Pseudomonadota bacterium]